MLPDILDVKINPVYQMNAEQGTPKEFMEKFAKDHPTYAQAVSKEEMIARDNMEVSA